MKPTLGKIVKLTVTQMNLKSLNYQMINKTVVMFTRFFFSILSILSSQLSGWTLSSDRVQFQRRQWHPTPVLLPGNSHGWRSLVGYNPWGFEELDTTEWLHFHFSLSCIEEGNGNPLQCSCLENPRGGGAWWAAIYGVAQSQTQLKWLSSSSSSRVQF